MYMGNTGADIVGMMKRRTMITIFLCEKYGTRHYCSTLTLLEKNVGIKIIMFASHLCHYFEPPLFSRCSGDDATSNLGLERIPGSKVILLPDICTLPFLLFDEFNFIYGVPSTYIISGLRAPVVVNSEGDDADNANDDDKSLCLELDASSFLGLAGCSTVRTQAGLS